MHEVRIGALVLKFLVDEGISGGKAAAAILTAGISILFVGLSRREELTEARCEHCEARWMF